MLQAHPVGAGTRLRHIFAARFKKISKITLHFNFFNCAQFA
jgi:hypothetical protein